MQPLPQSRTLARSKNPAAYEEVATSTLDAASIIRTVVTIKLYAEVRWQLLISYGADNNGNCTALCWPAFQTRCRTAAITA
jgi:hypothetical protein